MANVIVIGAGFGGLSAAALLAKDGHEVTILEKNNQVGGRASVWKSKGFTFDIGPSWYLMPDVFEDFFAQFGKKPSDYYDLVRLDPHYRMYFGKNDIVDIPASMDKIFKLFDQLEPNGGKKLKDYLEKTEFFYHTAMNKFVYKEFNSIKDFIDPSVISQASSLAKLLTSFDGFVSSYFDSDKAKKILEYVIVFLGGDPQFTPALYSILSYVDMKLGVWYPKGGFHQVPKGMAELAKSQGVTIKINHQVTKIITQKQKATRVLTDKGAFDADIVVANADYHFVETTLLHEDARTYQQEWWDKRTIAPSALLIYMGLDKRLRGLKHHTLVLDRDWQKHFSEIFASPSWPESPSYYICAPSDTDPTVAPQNSENIFILVPVASGLQDDKKTREDFSNKIITHLEGIIDENISDHVITKKIFSHKDFRQRYHAYKGTALGLSHTLSQTAIFRPKIQSSKVENLFYCGQYTHPGIGTAPSVIAGQIAARAVQKKYAI